MRVSTSYRRPSCHWRRNYTTGVGPVAEVCEIAIVDRTGETVVDTLVLPGRPIPFEATRIHGITNAAVANARSFGRVESDEFPALLSSTGRAIAIYNAEYDLRLLDQSSGDGQGSAWRERAHTHCIMELNAMYRGEWGDGHGSYTWQSLSDVALQCGLEWEGDPHQALVDARMALGVLRHMAISEVG